MIPSYRWFPRNLPARALWYANFANQFADVGASLGFTANEINSVNNDNSVFQFLANAAVEIEAYKRSVGEYREIITEENIGEPNPQFPANPALALPASIDTGMFERLVNLVERIRVAPNYTDQIGALLGILPTQPEQIAPSEVKPTIQTFAAETGYHFSVVVEGRKEADMWEVLILKKGAAGWQTVKTANGKSVDVTITPTTPGESEQIQVRVQLRKNNQNYGQPSAMVYVTVNP